MLRILAVCVAAIVSVVGPSSLIGAENGDFDIAPFARRCCAADRHTSQLEFDLGEARNAGAGAEKTADGRYIYGLQWTEERDISEIRFHRTRDAGTFEVEYWFRNWPYEPPHMPSIEDPVDDPWNGKWLTAAMKADCRDDECRVLFLPLTVSENPLAKNLPGVDYRRTIKLRLVFHVDPGIDRVQVFNGSKIKPVELRIQLGAGEKAGHIWKGDVQVYNGRLDRVTVWKGTTDDTASGSRFQVTTDGSTKGLLVKLDASEPGLPGSDDVTVVTLNSGDRTFSFAVSDVEKGPVYVPAFHAYVTLASGPRNFSPSIVKSGTEIRDLIKREPEQTYERASHEIPRLDPVHREGERLYLPLAADSSWQKFAFEWGGNIHISKTGTKAKGRELKRLEWPGDRIAWRLGTGLPPSFRPEWHDSTLFVLDDDLPVATAKWSSDGIHYTEEGFATLLSGPLSPDDPARNEETPTVLMVKLTAQNAGSGSTTAHLWLATEPDENVTFQFQEGELLAQHGELIRAQVQPNGARVSLADVPDGITRLYGIHIGIPLGAGQKRSVIIELPFVPRLTEEEHARLKQLDYRAERQRVIAYWRGVIAHAVPFDVPEPRFDTFARATIAHIHISTTKDPKSGLYMVPAASYVYQVFANEAAFQCVMLDALGDHQLAAEYLKTFVRLQGSEPFEGTFTGDQGAVYHGAKVDDEYDYTASQYNLDHGTVLWALAEHYLYTRDRQWLEQNAASMERAADWVIEQRKLTEVMDGGEKVLEYGLLPAGHLEDNRDWGHWFAVNAFAAAGMTQMARALTDIRSPEAEHYTQEAAAYVQDLRTAVIRASQRSPVVRLRNNTYVPWVPPVPYQRFRLFGPLRVAYYTRYPQKAKPLFRLAADREVLYGPMILLSMDIFHANEPFADWVLDDWEDNITLSSPLGLNVHGWVDDKYWFSQGGMVFQANLQNPVLVYLRRNEVPAAIRNLYNDFVACYYPDANAFTEEYHQWVHGSGPLYKVPDESRFVTRVRNTLVREDGDTLWLLAGVPRRWLEPGQRIQLDGVATYFGPMSLETTASASAVRARIQLPAGNAEKTAWLVLRLPDEKPIKSVEIDGRPWVGFDAARERVRLPVKPGAMQVVVRF